MAVTADWGTRAEQQPPHVALHYTPTAKPSPPYTALHSMQARWQRWACGWSLCWLAWRSLLGPSCPCCCGAPRGGRRWP